jgi:Bacteriocin-protection, YdeI or OmpD-Associated
LQTPVAPAILARDGCLCQYRRMSMPKDNISGGVVHDLPEDLRNTLASDAEALAAWEALTPLARNEWICWTISVKKSETRQQHVERVRTELKEGMRRPCCWLGCIHRMDKSISPSVQYVLSKRSKRSS